MVEEPGYLYVYLSNESETPSEVYFDDFTVSVSESRIVQLLDYYPYGMVANSWVRSGGKATRDLFQGKPYEEVLALSHFGARQYDASLGRWQGVDPANQFASPYTGMGNNPVSLTDPDGRFVPLVLAAAAGIGAAINIAANAGTIASSPDIWTGAARVLGFAAVGAVGGYASLYNPAAGGAITSTGNAILGGVIAKQSIGDIACT